MAFARLNLQAYVRDVRHELQAVQWPTRAATVRLTVLIIVVSVLVAAATGALDGVLAFLLEKFLLR